MSDQPEALRLADALDNAPYSCGCTNEAAAELRRQHAENEALRAIVQLVSTRVPHILAGGQQCTCSWCDDIRAARAALKEAK